MNVFVRLEVSLLDTNMGSGPIVSLDVNSLGMNSLDARTFIIVIGMKLSCNNTHATFNHRTRELLSL